jgi:hypothetical protein
MAGVNIAGERVGLSTKEITSTKTFSLKGVTTQVHLIILGFTWIASAWLSLYELSNLAIVTIFFGAFLLRILFSIINLLIFRGGLKVGHETNLLTTSVILIFSFGIPLVFFVVQYDESLFLSAFSFLLGISIIPFLYSKSGKTFKWVAAFLILLFTGLVYIHYFHENAPVLSAAFTGAIFTLFGLLNNPFIVRNNLNIE